MPKYKQLSNQLKNRLIQGDYTLQGLPPERQLALESGVSYMTARRAYQQLIDDGFLLRGLNGRVEVNRDRTGSGSSLQVAFLAPSFPSHSIARWRDRILQTAERVSGVVRPVLYTHWDDPVIGSTLDSFDGVFLLPSCEPIPPRIIQRIKQAPRPLVMLEEDFSSLGIPTVRQNSPVFVQHLLDHLEERGFREIACLNVQPHDGTVLQRLAQWQIWMTAHHLSGQLFDEPVEAYHDPTAQAYLVMQKLLANDEFHGEALLCITLAAAIGANRAMHEAGLRPGVDVAVCAVGGEGVAALQIPSITALEAPDVSPYIKICLDWMSKGGGAWSGPLLMQPSEPLLVVRESTSAPRPDKNSSSLQFAVPVRKENHHAQLITR